MFLTRIGFGSKAVITGDLTQIDLSEGKKSGLTEATRILSDIEGIGMITMTNQDVVRHPLVQKIISAYEKFEEKKKAQSEEALEARESKGRNKPSYVNRREGGRRNAGTH